MKLTERINLALNEQNYKGYMILNNTNGEYFVKLRDGQRTLWSDSEKEIKAKIDKYEKEGKEIGPYSK